MTIQINAFLAVRAGSTRVPNKNFRLIGGKALYQHLLDSALELSNKITIYLNTDHPVIAEIIGNQYGSAIKYYIREPHLGTSEASLDSYAYDFIKNVTGDYTVFLNPCSPFLKSNTIENAITHTILNNLDSCTASAKIQTHCFHKNHAINFSLEELQPRSQDLLPVHAMTSGFFIWKNTSFVNAFESKGFANFCGKFESYPVSRFEAVDIDTEEDIQVANALLSRNASFENDLKFCSEAYPFIQAGVFKPN